MILQQKHHGRMNLPHVFLADICLTFMAFFWVLLTSSVSANESIQGVNTLRVAVIYTEEPPYIYSTSNQEYRGIFPSVAQALSRDLNLKLEYFPTARKGLEQSLLDDNADMTWLSPDWVKNKEQLIFSESVFLAREFFYSLTPLDDSNGLLESVRGKSICVRQDYFYPRLNRLFDDKEAKAVNVSSQVFLLMNMLLKERCDLLYTNEHRANWIINRMGVEDKIWRSSQPLDQSKIGFMFNKKWQSKMPLINQALANIKRSGELERIIQTHIQSAKAQSE